MVIDQHVIHDITHRRHNENWEYNEMEKPLVVQVGGSNADTLIHASQLLQSVGYQEINLNVGCPANTATEGCYGASLMLDRSFPTTIGRLRNAISIPLTIKCRIGVNEHDSYEHFSSFIHTLHSVGITHFIIHARKAILNFTPSQNRSIPPLDYSFVYRIKKELPKDCIVEVNGGIETMEQIKVHYTLHTHAYIRTIRAILLSTNTSRVFSLVITRPIYRMA